MKCCLVYVTVKDFEEARRIAQTVVTEKLAACANIFPEITSFFQWGETLETATERALFLKTSTSSSEKLIQRVTELHSYDCPCVVCLPIEGGASEFLKWIDNTS